jgi:hypothetical protein
MVDETSSSSPRRQRSYKPAMANGRPSGRRIRYGCLRLSGARARAPPLHHARTMRRRRGRGQVGDGGAGASASGRGTGAKGCPIRCYPVDSRGRKVDLTMAYVGTRALFEKAGFHKAADTSSVINGFPRVVMRLDLR